MPRANDAIEAMLLEYADLQSILFDDLYKPRAYEKAARAVGGYPEDLAGKDLRDPEGAVGRPFDRREDPGVPDDRLPRRARGAPREDPGWRELTRIPGLGPKKAMVLYQELGVGSVDELEAAIADDRVAALRFGAKTQENIARGWTAPLRGDRVKIDTAMGVAESFSAHLSALRGQAGRVGRLAAADEGDDRGRRPAGGGHRRPAGDGRVRHASVGRACPRAGRYEVVGRHGRRPPDRPARDPSGSWGAAMIYFTGSKAHNIRIREMAVRQGLKLSEYGLFDAKSGDLLVADTEEAVYARLGMRTWSRRSGRTEARSRRRWGRAPSVLTERQLRGDLHTHTNLTDGLASLEDMVARGAELGYAYFAITDHAPNLYMQRMTEDKILAQRERWSGRGSTRR